MKALEINSSFSGMSAEHSFCAKFEIIKKISSSKFPVFLINDPETNNQYALKLFPYENQNVNRAFLNESRFTFLDHPNIISFRKAHKAQKVNHKETKSLASYIIMDYAPNGDFTRLVPKMISLKDEKLVRTYFHQLIEGLEYLHNNRVCHMDLKLDNLLIDENFTLKITDFDVACVTDDSYTIGRGTKNYRCPELREETCYDPYAADVYSAGIILFVLLTGCFPYLEDTIVEGYNLSKLLDEESPLYWKALASINLKIGEDAKDLFWSMIRYDPIERATLSEIKTSKWYSAEVYSAEELKKILA